MTERDFPGLDEAQHAAEKARSVLRDAVSHIEEVDRPRPAEDWQGHALRLRGVATMVHASALELAFCAGFVSAAYEADTSVVWRRMAMGEKRRMTPEEQSDFFNRFLDDSVKPFSKEIVTIWSQGGIAVVWFEPSERAIAWLRESFGWDGTAPVVRMPKAVVRAMADNCKEMGDEVTGKWLESKRIARVFAILHDASTLLINYEQGRGYSLEPGSTDESWMS